MKTIRVKDILQPIDGTLFQGSMDDKIRNAETDFYHLRSHTLLFDLNGNSHVSKGAWETYPHTVVVTERTELFPARHCKWTVIQVDDVERAFWRFVRWYRGLWNLPVIGVTGTCGKTTVKEMISHVLSRIFSVQSTYKSKNSLERNLSYLLGIDEKTDVGVFEMGVACPDDLLNSCSYFQPTIGIITTIGTDHLQHCGTQENYIKEKAKLLQGLGNRGILILNRDDPNIRKIDTSGYRGKILYFGLQEEADFHARDIQFANGGMVFICSALGETFPAYVPGYGEHNVYNALASLAACYAVGMDLRRAAGQLASFTHVESHLQFGSGINRCTVIDDTWSSNPTSTEAALTVLKQTAQGRKTIAILGKMELLGEHTRTQHALVGEKVVECGIDVLITFDRTAEWIGQRAMELGMNKKHVYFCRSPRQVYNALKPMLDEQTLVLIKTSMLEPRTEILKKMIIKGRTRDE